MTQGISMVDGVLHVSLTRLMDYMDDEILHEFLRYAVFNEKLIQAAVEVLAFGSAFDDEVSGLGFWFDTDKVERWAKVLDDRMPEVMTQRIRNLRFLAKLADDRAERYHAELFELRSVKRELDDMRRSRDTYARALRGLAEAHSMSVLDAITTYGEEEIS